MDDAQLAAQGAGCTNDGSVDITFDNVVSEHLAAERLYYRSTIFAKVDKLVACLLLALGVVTTCTVGLRWWTVIWFPLAFLEAFNLFSLRPLQIRWWFKCNPKFAETYHLRFGPQGMHFRTKTIDAHVAWDHYSRVLENKRLYVLVYGTRMYSVVPKRAFADAAQEAAFRALLAAHIPAAGGRT